MWEDDYRHISIDVMSREDDDDPHVVLYDCKGRPLVEARTIPKIGFTR